MKAKKCWEDKTKESNEHKALIQDVIGKAEPLTVGHDMDRTVGRGGEEVAARS